MFENSATEEKVPIFFVNSGGYILKEKKNHYEIVLIL